MSLSKGTRPVSGALPDREGVALIVLILIQSVCAVFFMTDVIGELGSLGAVVYFQDWHTSVELLATVALVLGIAMESWYLLQLLRREARTMRGLSIASGALNDLMEAYFRNWKLTPAEADVAAFTLKGMGIAEIAGLRGSREGTVKTHLNAIYRKAGVSGRGAFVSLLIEDLMGQPLVSREVSGGNIGGSLPSAQRAAQD